MNEYHLISSHDHFRWKSAGSSIIRCTRKLKKIDRPLLKYGKLSKLTNINLKESDNMASYHVKCSSSMDREVLNHYNLRMTAASHGMRWHSNADVSMHGKNRMSMTFYNADILDLSIDDMRK